MFLWETESLPWSIFKGESSRFFCMLWSLDVKMGSLMSLEWGELEMLLLLYKEHIFISSTWPNKLIGWGHLFLLSYSNSSASTLVERQTSDLSGTSPEPLPKSPLAEDFQTFAMMFWTGLPFSKSLQSSLLTASVPFYNADHNMSFSIFHHWYSMFFITDTVCSSSLIQYVLYHWYIESSHWYSESSITDRVSPSITDSVCPSSLIQWALPSVN